MAGYGWSHKSKALKAIEPEEAVAELERLREENGGLVTPAQMVEAARDPGHLFHGCFEWDDTKAAERYRRDQARHVIRSVRIYAEGREVAPAYVAVRVKTDDGASRRGYMESREAAQKENLRAQVLRQALKQMLSMRARFQRFAELAGVWQEVEAIAERHGMHDLIDTDHV